MAKIEGFKELSRKLSKMGEAAGGKALRSAAMSATLPALNAAKAAAPVGNPPFESGGDPYPIKTYKGNLRTPGFAKRNIARKSSLSRDKRKARVLLGVKPEAFYAINFIEFGTSKIAKRPWLEPSFKRSIPLMGARLSKRLKQLIDKAAKK
jgi:HK97 gp10 family phage protein